MNEKTSLISSLNTIKSYKVIINIASPLVYKSYTHIHSLAIIAFCLKVTSYFKELYLFYVIKYVPYTVRICTAVTLVLENSQDPAKQCPSCTRRHVRISESIRCYTRYFIISKHTPLMAIYIRTLKIVYYTRYRWI